MNQKCGMTYALCLTMIMLLCSPMLVFGYKTDTREKAIDYDDTKLEVAVKQFKASVIESLARSTNIQKNALDESSLRVMLMEAGKLAATITSKDGNRGIFLSPGRRTGNITEQIPGIYSMKKNSDGTIEMKRDGKTIPTLIPFFPTEPVNIQTAYLFFPLFGCGAWADPRLANNCFWLSVCLYTGAFCNVPSTSTN